MFEFIQDLVLQSTVVLAGLLFLLAVVLFVEKTVRNTFGVYRQRRYHLYEQSLLSQFAHEPLSFRPWRFRPKKWGDLRIIEFLLLDYARQFRGSLRNQFTGLFEILGYVDSEVARLRAWRWWVRAQAAKRLGEMGSRRAIPALRVALTDSNEEVWFMAALALAQIDRKTAAKAIYESLSCRLSHPNSSYVLEVVVGLGGEAWTPLLESLARQSETMRAAIVRALAELKSTQAVPFLLCRLKEERSPTVRVEVIVALGRIGDPTAIEPLRCLLTTASAEIRQAAVQALGRLQATEAKEGIRAALEDPDYWVGFRAGEALAGMGEVGRESLQRACASARIRASTMARYFLERT
ncbi:HEAT repeat domain-containing protein [Acidobacteriia bacterium AH_259_A11_L15]|nr:HEAT repeat domain-containing protein [Acidobacteriia bacterium AH_259_A11_L15]